MMVVGWHNGKVGGECEWGNETFGWAVRGDKSKNWEETGTIPYLRCNKVK
jgi:hypothetical protein